MTFNPFWCVVIAGVLGFWVGCTTAWSAATQYWNEKWASWCLSPDDEL